MIKVNWEKLPNWANFVAMDSDGVWSCYAEKPLEGGTWWYMAEDAKDDRVMELEDPSAICDLGADIHWENSLIERPLKYILPQTPEDDDDDVIAFSEAVKAWVDGVEVQQRANGGWFDVTPFKEFIVNNQRIVPIYTNSDYRIKPKIKTLASLEFPRPEELPLDMETTYWIPEITGFRELFISYGWSGDQFDYEMLLRGMVHLTKEAAVTHAKAIITSQGGVFKLRD